jgi:hypothetical protein
MSLAKSAHLVGRIGRHFHVDIKFHGGKEPFGARDR